MIHDPQESALFPELTEEFLAELQSYGEVVEFADGDILFREGQRDYPFYAVLSGQIRVTKQMGAEQMTLALHHRGQFPGEISMLTGGPAIANGVAVGPLTAIRVDIACFRQFVGSDDPLARSVVTAIAGRTHQVEAHSRQQDKLAALGKLSAGLAHELNNPAAAARRSAQLMRDALDSLRVQSIRHDCRFTEAQRNLLLEVEADLHSHATQQPTMDALERSDREDELASWLSDHNIEDAWDLAPTLVDAGFTLSCLDELAQDLQGDSLAAAIAWVEKSLRAANLAAEIQSATTRISELVAAMKEYTYMDRADFQLTDVHRGLESTLTIFGPRFKKTAIQVERHFDPNLPAICAHPGELNQVWTNLIDNALDAMGAQGKLTLATRAAEDGVIVTIGDTGPGIPPELQARIYEPFFTTKPVGQGTGLGLDIVYRIIRVRHGGDIQVHSTPGDTRFEVFLRINPPKEKA
jgi:signal transduction histidine kinase